MTYAEAITKLEGYKSIHGAKLNAPWRRNPNLNLLGLIDHWIELFRKKEPDDTVPPMAANRTEELVKGSPQVARTGGITLTDEDIEKLSKGERLTKEVVSGVVAYIRRR